MARGSTANGNSNSSNGATTPAPAYLNNTVAATSLKATPASAFFRNQWGYGRPAASLSASSSSSTSASSSKSEDQPAYRYLSWYLVYALLALFTLSTLYLAVGAPHSTRYHVYFYGVGVPLLAAVFALPAFALVAIPLSYWLDPSGTGCPEKYWVLTPPSSPTSPSAFELRWRGQKVPVLTLYEAYFAGVIDLAVDPATGAPYDLLTVLYHRHEFARFVIEFQHVSFFFLKFIPELLTHSRSQDVEQVREHYDRGDDFYRCFLGETMIYTSGIFHDENDTLEEAQRNKLDLVANKIHLKPNDQHLDLGCGWGSLIVHFADKYGSQSTGITLGKNQTNWANEAAKRKGVSDRARALCLDYRDSPKVDISASSSSSASPRTKNGYDKITCLEMSEHVGVKYYSQFCQQVYDMLDDDGIFFLQIAGLRRAWQFEDFTWGLFMGKYVFPGADASCPVSWVITQLEVAGFEIRSEETIGIHYSATIKRWYDNWLSNQAYIEKKYSARWFRTWAWFLGWSVISPEQGSASCYQIVCHKNTKRFDRKQFLAERKYWKV